MTEPVTYFTRLSAEECWALLSETTVGRIAWQDAQGIAVVPVNYTSDGGRIVFHTAPTTSLAALTNPTPVAFEVDLIDEETAVGWSVLVRGTSGPVEAAAMSWLDDRTVGIAIAASNIDGRVLSGTTRSEESNHD